MWRYEVKPDGTLANGRVFFDMTSAPGEDAIDGLKVDQQGNVYVSGPGGLWILSPTGAHLGTIVGPEHPHNFAWGGADGKTLYLTAQTGLYRIRLNIPGTQTFPGHPLNCRSYEVREPSDRGSFALLPFAHAQATHSR